MPTQDSIGGWVRGVGYALLAVVFALWILQMAGLVSVTLPTYLTAIGAGVLLQFVGAAIPHMRAGVAVYHESTESDG